MCRAFAITSSKRAIERQRALKPCKVGSARLAEQLCVVPVKFVSDCPLGQPGAKHFQQFTEFLPLNCRRPAAIAVAISAVALANRSAATGSAAVEAASPFFRRRRATGRATPAPRPTLAGFLKLFRPSIVRSRVHAVVVHFLLPPCPRHGS